ncbi:MAG TPA: pyruvate:ferredoxin (flavodoxin) oxidoreductase [Myxococcota bacterium]|nr:pyruvate:ferredoxin (flavodoxin) oxidoreductase [Myxococcota bacterium]
MTAQAASAAMERRACLDGNEAAARVAHRLSEVIAIYPITPASPMGELADTWSARGQRNLWGRVPEIVEMQSEGGAAGALHGAVQRGALATTFTASQGLLLMIPNFYKIAGELSPCVVHVAARTVATHALSIFGDHSDVMAARQTGFAMLSSGSVQEAHDFALVAHAASLRARVPFLHFFDGFRTSHEMNTIECLDDADLLALVDEGAIAAHRERRLTPDRPVLRGSAQNPDVFFQAREAANPFHDAVPEIVADCFAALGRRTGRHYGLVDYLGAPDAERVLVLMGSGAGAAADAVEQACEAGEKVGLLVVRLYRPFPAEALLAALPASARRVAVLDRTKEPGAPGEPLYQDVVATLARRAMARNEAPPLTTGGRYGLGGKEFTPALAKAALDELAGPAPRHPFTLGIVDDVGGTSLRPDPTFVPPREGVSALFFGLGSDGTVGASKSTAKIIAEHTDLHAQAWFVYDSKKSGAVTVSHLRFGPKPIRATFAIDEADLVACHQFGFLERMPIVERCRRGGTLLLNAPHPPEQVWDALPREAQEALLERDVSLHVVDADRVAREAGMGRRINTVMQPCFFALSGVLPREEALEAIRASIRRAYAKRGPTVVERNLRAVDLALGALAAVEVPSTATATHGRPPRVPDGAPDFVARVTARLLAGEGDLLPVSALPVDGTFPTGTARFEKRAIAQEIPIWEPSLCIDCGKCAIVCPHAAIRMKVFPVEAVADAPEGFLHKEFRSRELPDQRMTIQVAPDDCTGCGVCVDVCPARSKETVRIKSINMQPAAEHRDRERGRFDFFLGIPEADRTRIAPGTVKGSQVREPLFEFSGACAGCGETPYLKLLTQLFGDRMVVANATGCSSIYGGNLPTTPWGRDADGRGPAWSNSLFEDNAEFGLGMLLAQEQLEGEARARLGELAPSLEGGLAEAILASPQRGDAEIRAQRERVEQLKRALEAAPGSPAAVRLRALADELVRKSLWIVGGDGWAYDIGSAGLDHVLASGRNVNVLVLDTQVYSNTGGQSSKATPRGAVAKFASDGKQVPRKDLGMIASAYGNVFVAQIAIGADDQQTLRALIEAEAWPGPSLVIAYSTCIAHGIDMTTSMSHQKDAVRSGFWPLYRFHPGGDPHQHPLHLDSRKASRPLGEFLQSEARFAMLARSNPERARELVALAQADADERWRFYEQLAGLERSVPGASDAAAAGAKGGREGDE